MLDVLRIYLFAFGAFTIASGVIGYVKAKSSDSVIAGGVFGALLVLAGYLVGRGGYAGPVLGLIVSAMLAGRFTKAFRQNGKIMPGGAMALLGLIGIAISVVGLSR